MSALHEILLVDDNPADNFIHKSVIERLHAAGKITVAEDGAQALEYLQDIAASPERRMPELIFLDINMPRMNGWEFLDQLEAMEDAMQGTIVVMMLTTSLHPDDQAAADQRKELAGFLNKPLTKAALGELLEEKFPGRFSRAD
nr:response regulator [Oceanococcus sp. HetDA_MAG_MS8]